MAPHRWWWCCLWSRRTRAEKHECLGWRRIGRGGAAGGAGHTRAEKHECLGWRRIGRGGAAGGAGHTRAEKHDCPGGRRIGRSGAGGSCPPSGSNTKWDDTVLAAAALFGFYKLRRSGEFLRKEGESQANKNTCVRVGDTLLLKDGVELAWNDPRATGLYRKRKAGNGARKD